MDITAELARRRTESPRAPAVSVRRQDGWESVDWGTLHDNSHKAAGAAAGLPPGPVALVLDNSPAGVAVLFGLLIAGVAVAPLEPDTSQLADVRSPVRRVSATVVGPPGGTATTAGPPDLTYPDLLTGRQRDAVPPGHEGEVLQLTSGSTGTPKLARQPAGNAVRGARLYRDLHDLGPDDVLLAAVPLAHSFGLVGALTTALVTGAHLRTGERFSTRAVLDGLERDATVLLSTPLGCRLLAGAIGPHGRRTGLRVALCSGGPLSPEVAASAADRLGVPVRQVYGSTETGLIACRHGHAEDGPADALGVMAPGVSWRLRTGNGELTEYGEGTLLVRTSTMLLGHRGTDRPPEYDRGWYVTGDTARVDAAGRVTVLGRKASFVNVGGRKVNAGRVEAVVGDCPGVREAAAYGVVNSSQEEELWAALVLEDGYGPEDVMSYCRSRLTPYETPHHLQVVTALPRNAMGKVVRGALPGAGA
ncbi:class I adenylate-forming enzyme family protein [Streptomyces sp. NPDC020731]|uniref:class I adenylate-forming enzyme family protein n=1 Tax=Streptomyces sp. NPDC020731 TaxID=3365085 RepID=UPI0037A4BFE2